MIAALTDYESWLVLFHSDSNWQFLQSAARFEDRGRGIPRAPRHIAVQAIRKTLKRNHTTTCK